MSGGACAFTTPSGMVLCYLRQVAIIRRSSLACPGHKRPSACPLQEPIGYQHCKEKHLHRYLAEFDFRYNTRTALGYNDFMRAELAAKGIVGKRLTYRRPYACLKGQVWTPLRGS